MDETQLKRHNLVFISKQGKDKIWSDISPRYDGESKHLAEEVLQGNVDIPGFVRRNDAENTEGIAIGFVHHKRIDGNRIRIGAFTAADDVRRKYMVQLYAFVYNSKFHRGHSYAHMQDSRRKCSGQHIKGKDKAGSGHIWFGNIPHNR